MAVAANNAPAPALIPPAAFPSYLRNKILRPDLASSLQICVFEEVPGQIYLLRQTGLDKNRTIKSDLPHPSGYWEIELVSIVGDCLYFGTFAVPTGTRPTLDVWQRACSSWIADDTTVPPANVIHGRL